MAAFERYEANIHPECGHPADEAFSPKADPFAKDRTHIYKADLPIRCHACTALNLEKKKYDGENYDAARVWTVSKIDLT